jgi:hypothetical protein
MPLIAHAADWIESIVFGVPLIGFLAWLAIATVRDRRRGDGPEGPAASQGDG